jgi:hypothetical protein
LGHLYYSEVSVQVAKFSKPLQYGSYWSKGTFAFVKEGIQNIILSAYYLKLKYEKDINQKE